MPGVDPRELEPELEALIARHVRDAGTLWRAASPEDIDAQSKLARDALPRTYQWVLRRLGGGLGDIGYPSLDFSPRRIVAARSAGEISEEPGFLCIAFDDDPDQPQHVFYDLNRRIRNDAAVVIRGPENSSYVEHFDTLREMLAYSAFTNHRLDRLPWRCDGLLIDDGPDAWAILEPRLVRLGFSSPIPHGTNCLLFESASLALNSFRSPRFPTPSVIPFRLGGPTEGSLRQALGQFTYENSLKVGELEWQPL